MIRNYILIGWRSICKNPLFSFINIFGLALSMSVCMMVLLRIVDNFDYDSFHPQPENTYRILSELEIDHNTVNLATTPVPLQDVLENDTEIVAGAINLYPALKGKASNEAGKQFDINGAFTQPAFFRIFGFSLRHGDATTALVHPNSIVLSDATARKFFGDKNPVGELVTFQTLGTFLVTGVMEIAPAKSHITFEAYASASSLTGLENDNILPRRIGEWDTFEETYTYVLLNDPADRKDLDVSLHRLATTLKNGGDGATIDFHSQKISSITPGWTQLYHETSRGSSWSKLIAEISIALIILVSACFNYTNLSIARALTRGKEVGIRKISGARRWEIFAQYITESVIVAFLALCVAQIILAFILEYKPFNSGYEMVPDIALDLRVLSVFLIFSALAGLMAGAMPAWILSAFKPVKVLRSMWSEKVLGSLSLRKALMVFQFALSLVILVFLSAFYRQFKFMGSADGGFAKKDIVIIPIEGNASLLDAEMARLPGIEIMGHTSAHFGENPSGSIQLYENASRQNYHQFEYYLVDAGLINMMQLEIIAGNNFRDDIKNDLSILVNETAVKRLGYNTSEDALGTVYYLQDSSQVEIRGVIRDFYHRSVGHAIQPLVFRNTASGFQELLLKVDVSSQEAAIAPIELAWKKVNGGEPLKAVWLDEQIAERNNPSADVSLLGFLAFMTVAIATMGLLGLVVYTVETRRKEISIRKIVGASVSQIALLLSAGYTRLLIISGLIALPTGYILSNFFLMAFANRVSFGIVSLLLCFALLLVVGLVTIISQTWRAASQNPARNLCSE